MSGFIATPLGSGIAKIGQGDPLRDALLDSRQRWRDIAAISCDLVFETDAEGRFVFLAPDPVLGWRTAMLLGQPAQTLLADRNAAAFNPFAPATLQRRRRAWLLRKDGTKACVAFAAAPLTDEEGRIIGARGAGIDMTEQDAYDAAVAAQLRRGEVVDHILWQMRQEVLAPRMMQAVLEALVQALGAEGAALVDTLGTDDSTTLRHQSGAEIGGALPTALRMLGEESLTPASKTDSAGHQVLTCPSFTRFGERTGLVLWREPGSRPWTEEDRLLSSSATGIIRMVLEHEAIQREMARQARTDPLTGLLNRRAFLDEMNRRIERLDREDLPGTLMFVDLDNFKPLNDEFGHDVGDDALRLTSELLRRIVRPTDLVARFGGDEFALWLDGADEFAAAERAEDLRRQGPGTLAHLVPDGRLGLTMSIGIAPRRPASGEEIESLMQRADKAMYEVKRSGRGNWRVSHEEPF
jgi:diguanylate cyclase (GGDEF)-like protein/PAS domain S-box-containing protein